MEEFGFFLDGLLLVGGNSVICGDFNYWVDDHHPSLFQLSL